MRNSQIGEKKYEYTKFEVKDIKVDNVTDKDFSINLEDYTTVR